MWLVKWVGDDALIKNATTTQQGWLGEPAHTSGGPVEAIKVWDSIQWMRAGCDASPRTERQRYRHAQRRRAQTRAQSLWQLDW